MLFLTTPSLIGYNRPLEGIFKRAGFTGLKCKKLKYLFMNTTEWISYMPK
jgi:hypothetical protein